jgi:nucleoside-diphosphate-sugar epimerase
MLTQQVQQLARGAGAAAQSSDNHVSVERVFHIAYDIQGMQIVNSGGIMSTILVTGATGLSGHFVVRELQQRGYAVRGLARQASAAKLQALGVDVAIGDLADPDSLRRACDGVDGIVHAACTFSDSTVDIAAMQALLGGWQAGPFVFFSSLDVYGFSTAPLIDEETPLDETHNDYARGKVVSELLLEQAAQQQGRRDFTSLRAPHIWGPHPTARQRLLDYVKGNTVLLPGGDEVEWSQNRDAWIDARDLAWVVAECLARPVRGPVNVLAGHFVWHDLFTEVIRLSGAACQIVHKPLAAMNDEEQASRRFYAQSWRYDDRTLRQALAFQPGWTWQQTVAASVALAADD